MTVSCLSIAHRVRRSAYDVGVLMDLASAIQSRQVVAFTYDDLPRVVQPATYGRTTTGKLTLRGCQTGGQSRRNSIPCWELYTEAKIIEPTPTGATFEDFAKGGYTRGDSGFSQIIAEH